ncbi:MgtC/SapB family protein [Paenibacillus contaminans]|jgi:putative Mg2+ transporter-C (MgtC) family protein|uniref:Magnesium transporter MgtC n=1 Tax=Paenibacillus contaminans TaxID=450362 RepID=A0A329MC26_9BACL|nr:MgtC/SapB family protein [Paenibacillus contaminans]RAV17655.1 magnesium transporter MgtC [Paenibacillus contaminans]
MSPWEIDPLHLTLRLVLALVLGGLIGFERERHSHAAGFRTNILVCLGSTLIMLLSMYGFSAFVDEYNVRMDPARLAAQVLPGIGFLGAGVILRNGLSVTGLTTSATLLVVAAIGLSVGAGFYYAAVLSTFMVLLSLWVLNIVEKKYFRDKRVYAIKIRTLNQPGTLGRISGLLDEKGVDVRKLSMEEEQKEDGSNIVYVTLSVKIPKPSVLVPLIEGIERLHGITGVSVE